MLTLEEQERRAYISGDVQTATRQARARWRQKGAPRTYPTLRPFMTTAQYLREYEVLNAPAVLKPWTFTGTLDRVAPKIVGPEVVVEEVDPAHAARLFG